MPATWSEGEHTVIWAIKIPPLLINIKERGNYTGGEVIPQLECVVIGGAAAHPVTYGKEHQPTEAEQSIYRPFGK